MYPLYSLHSAWVGHEYQYSAVYALIFILIVVPCQHSQSWNTIMKKKQKLIKSGIFRNFVINPIKPKFAQCFFIGLGLSESFARTLLGKNGYFIGFWHFCPNFKILWHASEWTLCLQKCWILLIYYVVRLQYNFHAHGKFQRRKKTRVRMSRK